MVLKRRDWIDWRMHVGFVNGDQLGRGKIRDCGRLGCAMGKGERELAFSTGQELLLPGFGEDDSFPLILMFF